MITVLPPLPGCKFGVAVLDVDDHIWVAEFEDGHSLDAVADVYRQAAAEYQSRQRMRKLAQDMGRAFGAKRDRIIMDALTRKTPA